MRVPHLIATRKYSLAWRSGLAISDPLLEFLVPLHVNTRPLDRLGTEPLNYAPVRQHLLESNSTLTCQGFEHTGAVDVFSSGVVVFELAVGYRLFDTSDALTDVFAAMEDVLGPFGADFYDLINQEHPGILTKTTSTRPNRSGQLDVCNATSVKCF